MATASNVALKDGPIVSVNAIRLLEALEAGGCAVWKLEDGVLHAGPPHLSADAEREAIRRLKPELLALVGYCEGRE